MIESFEETVLLANCVKLMSYAKSEKKKDVVSLVKQYSAIDEPSDGNYDCI